jgi:hypothetical protein
MFAVPATSKRHSSCDASPVKATSDPVTGGLGATQSEPFANTIPFATAESAKSPPFPPPGTNCSTATSAPVAASST